ncbi:hypothetical protein AAC387_Pa09g0587 [Persea americana]
MVISCSSRHQIQTWAFDDCESSNQDNVRIKEQKAKTRPDRAASSRLDPNRFSHLRSSKDLRLFFLR